MPFKLFLLGGYDLEMQTIKQLLEGRGDCTVLDKSLQWDNALLSAYQDSMTTFTDVDTFGIELLEDIPLPPNYHRIDHHNAWNSKPSSIEQVAEIMHIVLNRDQQLVAANDKGYIPAMKALGATDLEIADIRRRDREAQGVCEVDEQLAEESLSDHLSRYGSLLVVKSLGPRFSPICDRLFPYQRLLIYTDLVWEFYGEGKDELVNLLDKEIKKGIVYHGGGDNGYIGCVKGAYDNNLIIKFVEQIINKYGNH